MQPSPGLDLQLQELRGGLLPPAQRCPTSEESTKASCLELFQRVVAQHQQIVALPGQRSQLSTCCTDHGSEARARRQLRPLGRQGADALTQSTIFGDGRGPGGMETLALLQRREVHAGVVVSGAAPGRATVRALDARKRPRVRGIEVASVARRRCSILAQLEEAGHPWSLSMGVVRPDGTAEELEAVDELSRMLEDLFLRRSGVLPPVVTPCIVPGSTAIAASMDSLMEVTWNGERVVVDVEAPASKP